MSDTLEQEPSTQSVETRVRGRNESGRGIDWFSLVATPLAFVAVGVAVIALVLSGNKVATVEQGAGEAAGPVGPSTVQVTLSDYSIVLSPATIPAGPVRWEIKNTAATEHNAGISGLFVSKKLKKNQVQVIETPNLGAGTFEVYCDVPGHKDLGMVTKLTVTASGSETGTAATASVGDGTTTPAGQSGAEQDWKALDAAHEKVVQEFLSGPPAKTKGIGNQPLDPKIENGVPVFDLTAKVVQWEVAPGTTYEAWTYNGAVPGPEIRIKQGETVKVRLKNELPESTSIHWHGLELADNKQDGVTFVTQDPIEPGQTYEYTLSPINCGSHMYHSHHAADAQVPLGLLGAFIVECTTTPVPAFAEHDTEYTEVLTDGPLGFGINGKGFPATQPIVTKVGERTLLRFMNEGLIIHPMHLHGHTMTVVAKDGNFLPEPYVVDTINIAPGERYDVIVNSQYPGAWAFHCHILTHAESENGLHGMTTVWVVQP
jgi:manganese oxidase